MKTIDTHKLPETLVAIKAYASQLGYEMEFRDCQDVVDSGYNGEPLKSAVRDWLNTWETCRDLGDDDDN
jgi:hypothetical protein